MGPRHNQKGTTAGVIPKTVHSDYAGIEREDIGVDSGLPGITTGKSECHLV